MSTTIKETTVSQSPAEQARRDLAHIEAIAKRGGEYDDAVFWRNVAGGALQACAELREIEAAAAELHAEVEMAESVGVCLPDRTASLHLGALLSQATVSVAAKKENP